MPLIFTQISRIFSDKFSKSFNALLWLYFIIFDKKKCFEATQDVLQEENCQL